MAMASLYRRILPSPPAIDLASSEGKKLFSEAIQNGTMENFFKLISYFQTQSEPAYCGLASLSMVLNALSIDPGRNWKGPWRWFDENMLDCCEPLERVKDKGISFGKVVCLAHCAGANIKAFRTNQTTIDDFRKHVVACSSSDNRHMISSYNRGTFNQTGTGHFSPIGGYHAEQDMALILDVARFKYPPHWVPLGLLWEAMDTVDETTGLHRGFMLVSRHQRAPSLLYSLSCNHESWITTAKYLMDDVPWLLASETLKHVKNVLSIIFTSLPSDFSQFIKWLEEIRRKEPGLSEEEKGRLIIKEEVLKQVQETELYKHVTSILSQEKPSFCSEQTIHPASIDVLTMLLLALPPNTWFGIKDHRLLNEISCFVSIENFPSLLQEEVSNLRAKLLMSIKCKDNELEDPGFKCTSSLLDETMFLQRSSFYSNHNSHKSRLSTSCSVNTPSPPFHGVFSVGNYQSLFRTSWDGVRHTISFPYSALYRRQCMWARHQYTLI